MSLKFTKNTASDRGMGLSPFCQITSLSINDNSGEIR